MSLFKLCTHIITSKASLYILNAFLIILVGYHILPDLSLNENEFYKVTGLVSSVRHENYDSARKKELLFNNLSSERIIITISDRLYHEYYVSDIYKKYWDHLLKPSIKGKEIVLYLGKGKQQEDPFRIELDGKLIYGTDIRFKRNVLIVLFTCILSCYNLFYFFKSKPKADDMSIVPSKKSRIRNFFLNK